MLESKQIDFDLDQIIESVSASKPSIRTGLLILPNTNWRDSEKPAFMPETYDFLKWVKKNSTENIEIAQPQEITVADLRSSEYWFPIVYVFSDVSVQVYLGLVANYIYDKIKGSLSHDKNIIHLDIVKEQKGKHTRFSFDGDYEALKATIKKIDVNKLMKD